MKIKICGVTSPDEALLAADLGVTHIGLNFYPPSPRYLHTEHALAITQALHQLSAAPLLVGVFVNENADTIRQKMDMYGLDIAQLSGNETKDTLRVLGGCAYKAYRLGETTHTAFPNPTSRYGTPDFMIDAHVPGQYGGTGQSCDWEKAADIARRHDVFLAGGLPPENVIEAIERVHPWGVDVASGIERTAGTKDTDKMKKFVSNALVASDSKPSETQTDV